MNYHKSIIYGLGGIGKTTLAASALECPEFGNIFLADIEGNTQSIKSKCEYYDLDKGDWGKTTEGKLNVFKIPSKDYFTSLLDNLLTMDHPYDTLIVDSITALNNMVLADIMALAYPERKTEVTNLGDFKLRVPTTPLPTPGRPEFMKLHSSMGLQLNKMVNLSMNIILTALPKIDDETKEVNLLLIGQMQTLMPAMFQQTMYLKTVPGSTARVLLTQPQGRFFAKDISEGGKLGSEIKDPTFRKILDKLNG